ncbi:putative efflux protein, MATE family [Tindallia magadiensis]|uniref:Multidrug export protein MepA n=1 Tax=Tindallia magadiensis TaxID=69895 RepID=A0A1I3E385_9FIRM|nr:MATE family efflux transporter [Tindallia magadiensis]SFH93273.1 putative efflux protein, MATE family [Tindallia magadiensis]
MNREAFLKEPLGKLIGKNATPAVASMLFMALYQMIDGIMVGRRLGPEALASVNLLYPIIALLVGLAVMLGVGGNARIAILLGEGKSKQASQVLGLILILGLALGLVGSFLSVWLMPNILKLLGTSGELGIQAAQYLSGMAPFFALMIAIFILEQSVRNDGQPHVASMVMAMAALLNIGLDYVFLYILDFGIRGAGLATGISQSVGALVYFIYFIGKTFRKEQGLCFAKPDTNRQTVKTIVINGSSELFNSLAMGIVTFLINRSLLNHIGGLGVAAFTLVQYVMVVGIMIITGIGNGIQPILSYNYGAGLSERVYGTWWRVLAIGMVIGGVLFLFMSWQMEKIALLFLPGQPEAVALTLEAASYLRWTMWFMPTAILGSIYFTALEQAFQSLTIAVSKGLIFPVVGLLFLPVWLGATGVWLALVITDALAMLVVILCYGYQRVKDKESIPFAKSTLS